MTPAAPPPLYLVPRMPERTAKQCSVPACGQDGRLYPGGWLCEEHKPGAPLTPNETERTAR